MTTGSASGAFPDVEYFLGILCCQSKQLHILLILLHVVFCFPAGLRGSSGLGDQTLTNGVITLTIAASNGLVSRYQDAKQGIDTPLTQQFLWYPSSKGDREDGQARCVGFDIRQRNGASIRYFGCIRLSAHVCVPISSPSNPFLLAAAAPTSSAPTARPPIPCPPTPPPSPWSPDPWCRVRYEAQLGWTSLSRVRCLAQTTALFLLLSIDSFDPIFPQRLARRWRPAPWATRPTWCGPVRCV